MLERHLFTAALLLFSLTSHANAQSTSRPPAEAQVPDFNASTGLIRVPSAYVQHDDTVSIFGAAVPHTAIGGAIVGIANRVEIGVASRDIGGDRVIGTAKVSVLPEQLLRPAVSVGVIDRSQYVVVSKFLIPYFVEAATGRKHVAVKLHAGYGDGLFRRTVFGGIEVVGDGGVSVIGEVVGGHGSGGLRYVHGGWSATAAMLDSKNAAGSVGYAVDLR